MKGQSQTEYLLIVGIIVFSALLFLYFGVEHISTSNKVSKAQDALTHLTEKVDELSSLTGGTRDSVWIDIPSSSYMIKLLDKKIVIVSFDDPSTIIFSKDTLSDLMGRVNLSGGLQQVYITKINDTLVKLGTDPLVIEVLPECVDITQGTQSPITVNGVDFQQSSAIVLNGNSVLTTYVTSGTLTFTAQGILQGNYRLAVRNFDNTLSNSLCFEIYTPPALCSCQVALGGGDSGLGGGTD